MKKNKITFKDYDHFVRNKPVPETPSFYKLWRLKCEDSEYTRHEVEYQDNSKNKAIGTIWRFPIQPLSKMEFEYHPTFEDAYESMRQPSQVDSWIYDDRIKNIFGYQISRLGFGPLGTRDFYIDYWNYDRFGKEYNRASCSSYHWNTRGIHGKYLGRLPEQIPFKEGDLVECGLSDRAEVYSMLGIVIGIPRTVEEVWNEISDDVNRLNCDNPLETYFEAPDMAGDDRDEYFILYGPYEDSMKFAEFYHPLQVRPPSFEIPEEAKEALRKYYDDYLARMEEDE